MALSEFALIQDYFSQASHAKHPHRTLLGIGDDAAIIETPDNQQLVLTMDTLVSGKHFPEQTRPEDIAWKALAVNVSDLAAMGAEPAWFLLSLTMPRSDQAFLASFSTGLFAAASEFQIELVGGDTCQGPLSISIQAGGLVDRDCYVTRHKARIGDRIFVSGIIGSAAIGLAQLQQRISLDDPSAALTALNRPQPRTDLRFLIQQYATAAIDVSDGLVADLGHILQQSRVGADIYLDQIPFDPWIVQSGEFDYGLYGGDDYQLLFSVNPSQVSPMLKQANEQNLDVQPIGTITDNGFYLVKEQRRSELNPRGGFDHFAS